MAPKPLCQWSHFPPSSSLPGRLLTEDLQSEEVRTLEAWPLLFLPNARISPIVSVTSS